MSSCYKLLILHDLGTLISSIIEFTAAVNESGLRENVDLPTDLLPTMVRLTDGSSNGQFT